MATYLELNTHGFSAIFVLICHKMKTKYQYVTNWEKEFKIPSFIVGVRPTLGRLHEKKLMQSGENCKKNFKSDKQDTCLNKWKFKVFHLFSQVFYLTNLKSVMQYLKNFKLSFNVWTNMKRKKFSIGSVKSWTNPKYKREYFRNFFFF